MALIDLEEQTIDANVPDSVAVPQEYFTSARDTVVEVPNIKWDDIGGSEETTRALREMVLYPNTHVDTLYDALANPGDNVGLNIKGLDKNNIPRSGDVLVYKKDPTPALSIDWRSELRPTDAQPTEFVNTAFTAFIVLIT